MHSTSFLLWLGVCLVNSKPAAAARHKFPYLDLLWTAVDSFNGIYFVDIQVGNPPQTIRLGHDTGSSDIFMHSTADTAYLESCSAQTPNVCFPGYDNTTSTTFHEIGPRQFQPPILGLPTASGSYITDTLRLPGGISGITAIPAQVMGSTWAAPLPIGLLGTSFPPIQAGVFQGLFPRYPSFTERLVSQGVISAATEAIYLDPSRSEPDVFGAGEAIYGAVDTALFKKGGMITLPAVEAKRPVATREPINWNLALGKLTKSSDPAQKQNILHRKEGISCVIDTGTSFFALPNSSFTNLVSAFPSAKLNSSVPDFPGGQFWEIPCSERENLQNTLEFTFIDPRDPKINVSLEVPPWQVIWPAKNLVKGAAEGTCALNAVSWEGYFGSDSNVGKLFECVLGVSVMKSGYWVFDTGNAEASIAVARERDRGQKGKVVEVPSGGVRRLKL